MSVHILWWKELTKKIHLNLLKEMFGLLIFLDKQYI
jgi:hypothetical protein